MDGDQLVATAARLAAGAHDGALDKFGRPYFAGHVADVARAVAQGGARPEVVAAAYLHDTIEKTSLTIADLAGAGMPDRVIALVVLLTHDEGQPRAEYLAAIRADPDALLIKRADHLVNSDPARLAELPREEADALRRRYESDRTLLLADG